MVLSFACLLPKIYWCMFSRHSSQHSQQQQKRKRRVEFCWWFRFHSLALSNLTGSQIDLLYTRRTGKSVCLAKSSKRQPDETKFWPFGQSKAAHNQLVKTMDDHLTPKRRATGFAAFFHRLWRRSCRKELFYYLNRAFLNVTLSVVFILLPWYFK